MLLKTLRSTDTYILTCFNSSMVSLLYHTAQGGGKQQQQQERKIDQKQEAFQAVKIFVFWGLVVFLLLLLKLPEWHKQALQSIGVREERGSTLQQTEASEKDGYSPSLSHPSQTHRLLQLSHPAKQLALQKIVFSFEDLCSASAS